MAYYGVNLTGFHLPFNFALISVPWDPASIATLIKAYEKALPPRAWPNWVLGNHDRSRVVTRLGPKQARIAAILLLTLRGTPTIYQGEEIGMTDVPISASAVEDPWEKRVPGLGLGRDPERTPMQWDDTPNAGFTTGRPWLPIGSNYTEVNVASELRDCSSMLSLYRKLLKLRSATPALYQGCYKHVQTTNAVLTFERHHEDTRLRVALNFDEVPHPIKLAPGKVALSSYLDMSPGQAAPSFLRPHEGLIVVCDPSTSEP